MSSGTALPLSLQVRPLLRSSLTSLLLRWALSLEPSRPEVRSRSCSRANRTPRELSTFPAQKSQSASEPLRTLGGGLLGVHHSRRVFKHRLDFRTVLRVSIGFAWKVRGSSTTAIQRRRDLTRTSCSHLDPLSTFIPNIMRKSSRAVQSRAPKEKEQKYLFIGPAFGGRSTPIRSCGNLGSCRFVFFFSFVSLGMGGTS